MPGPIAHTFFAHRAFQKCFPGINLRAFLIGTHLPDIRNLSGHAREHTHRRDITVADVLAARDVFEMGFLLHSYVDALHWRVIADAGVTERYYGDRLRSTAWKMVAEEVIYPKMPDMQPMLHFFEDILEDELRYGIAEQHIEQWHDMMARYLSHPPKEKNLPDRLAVLGVPDNRIGGIVEHSGMYRDDARLQDYLGEAVSRFDRELAAA